MLAIAALASGATGANAAPTGAWGEDPALVPDFALPQERRAPKVPAGDEIYARYRKPRTLTRSEEALLVCRLGVVVPPARSLAGGLKSLLTLGLADLPNVTLGLRVRDEPMMTLWAPDLHQTSYISFPRVTLSPGDRIEVKLLDRKAIGRSTSLGGARLRWNGESPFSINGPHSRMTCVVVTREEVAVEVRPWLDKVDRQFARLEGVPMNPALRDLGYPAALVGVLAGRYKTIGGAEAPLRYVAGHLGWEDAQVQARLRRLAAFERTFRDAAVTAMVARVAAAPPLPLTLNCGEVVLRGLTLRCSPQRSSGDDTGVDRGCALSAVVDGATGQPLRCADVSAVLDAMRVQTADGHTRSPIRATLGDRRNNLCAHDNQGRARPGPLHLHASVDLPSSPAEDPRARPVLLLYAPPDPGRTDGAASSDWAPLPERRWRLP